jgi:hypothetical protein
MAPQKTFEKKYIKNTLHMDISVRHSTNENSFIIST